MVAIVWIWFDVLSIHYQGPVGIIDWLTVAVWNLFLDKYNQSWSKVNKTAGGTHFIILYLLESKISKSVCRGLHLTMF